MFVKIKENQKDQQVIEEVLEGMGNYLAKELLPLYKAQNNFFTTRWSDNHQKAMYYSPCEVGEEIPYNTKQDWMLYEVYDELLYKQLSHLMLEDWQQQDIVDSHLSYVS